MLNARQVEEQVVTDEINGLVDAVSALGELAKSTPKRKADAKAKTAGKSKKPKKA